MSLLQVGEILPSKDVRFKAVQYSVRMWDIGNMEEYFEIAQRAILAANINILRRSVSYAYLFIDSHYSFQDWFDHQSYDSSDREYVASLDSITLGKSINLFDHQSSIGNRSDILPRIVIAIRAGDILPFMNTIDSQEFSLLCLPFDSSLTDLENLIYSAANDFDVTNHLLDLGGVIISMPDSMVFSAVSRKTDIGEYFR